MPGATTKYALPYPLGTDPTNIPADMQALAAAVDSIFASDYSGALSARPAPGKAGRHFTEDGSTAGLAGTTWRDDGAAYRSVGSRITATGSTDTIQVLRGAVGQSGRAWEYQNSAGTPVAYFDSAGALNAPAATIGAYAVLTTNSPLPWSKLTGLPSLVNSVAGRSGAVALTSADLSDFGSSAAAYTAKHLRRSDAAIDTSWAYSGQAGQPAWLWGTNDGTTMQVYNPSNFNVNNANWASSSGYVDWANVGNKPSLVNTVAGRAGAVSLSTSDISGLSAYVAAASVSHASTSDSATSAGTVPWSGVSSRPLTNIRTGTATVSFSGGAGLVAHGLSGAPTGAVVCGVTGGATNVVVMLDSPISDGSGNLRLRAMNVSNSTNYTGNDTVSWMAFN